MKSVALAIIALLACGGCGNTERGQGHTTAAEAAAEPAAVAATRTEGVEHGAPVNAAIWESTARPADSLVVAASGIAGLQYYAADGRRVGATADLEAGFVVVAPAVEIDGTAAPLLVVYDSASSSIGAFRLERSTLALQPVMAEPIAIADEVTGLCHHRSRLADRDYLYAVTDGGLIHHYELYGNGPQVAGRLLRTIPSGKGSGFCAVDPRDGTLYVSDESNGIWRLGAEPESDTAREPLDMRAPFGTLSDDIKGIAIRAVNSGLSYLLLADVGAAQVVVYALPSGERRSAFTIDGLAEPEGMVVSPVTFGDAYPGGVLAVADEDDATGGPDLKLVAWRVLSDAIGLEGGNPASVAGNRPAVVRPVRETDVMPSFGDAADDPAIWVHPDDPESSLVIGTNKRSGLHVYDLKGRTLQVLPDGRMNNVDLRDGFPLGGEAVTLVIASNRSNDSLAIYRIDVAERSLAAVADGVLDTGFADPYGACMYHSAETGEFYAFVNEGGAGTFRQWRLFDNGEGRVAIELLREFEVGSQSEGCVADDETGALYVGEEDGGLWRYSAEADADDTRVLIDSTEDGGHLTADVEGVSLVYGDDGRGYLVVSNQGADNYAVYRREGDNAWIGHFHIVADASRGIDGVSETDGLEVTGMALGAEFPGGLLVVQDGRNIAPEEPQNFKFVSWAEVLEALDVGD